MNKSSIQLNYNKVVKLLKEIYNISFSHELNMKILKKIIRRYGKKNNICKIIANKDDLYHHNELNKLNFILNSENVKIIEKNLSYNQFLKYKKDYDNKKLKNVYGMAHNQVMNIYEFKKCILNDQDISIYDLIIKNKLLIPNSNYFLRDNKLIDYNSESKYMNFSYYGYFLD